MSSLIKEFEEWLLLQSKPGGKRYTESAVKGNYSPALRLGLTKMASDNNLSMVPLVEIEDPTEFDAVTSQLAKLKAFKDLEIKHKGRPSNAIRHFSNFLHQRASQDDAPDLLDISVNPLAPNEMIECAQRVHDAIGGELEIKANQTWIRASIRPNNSVWFTPRADGLLAIHLGGGNIDRYGDYAIFHWGQPKRKYVGPKGKREWLWRMDLDSFTSTLLSVLRGSFEVPGDDKVVADVDRIYADQSRTTYEKEILAKTRIGHSNWAKAVKRKFKFSCAVEPMIIRNLIASHIKPWAECEGSEKTDLSNGLCLSRNIDGLFEDGLVSFSDDGSILLSNDLLPEELEVFRLTGTERIEIDDSYAPYLEWHRKNKFESEE